MTMDYDDDAKMLRDGPVEDENLRFASNITTSAAPAEDLALVS